MKKLIYSYNKNYIICNRCCSYNTVKSYSKLFNLNYVKETNRLKVLSVNNTSKISNLYKFNSNKIISKYFSSSNTNTSSNDNLDLLKKTIDKDYFESNNYNNINNNIDNYLNSTEEFNDNNNNITNNINKQQILSNSEFNDKQFSELYNRNFKTLLMDCYKASKFINNLYTKESIKVLCEIFIDNIIKTNDYSQNEKNTLKLIENFILMKKNFDLSESDLIKVSKITLNSFLYIYEFLDRGMKGFLTGDIHLNTIYSIQTILDEKIKELNEIEKDFIDLNLNMNDFYESMFKIDYDFFKLNSSGNLVIDLNRHLENSGIFSKKMLYYVNLKHTQFSNNLKVKLQEKLITNNIYKDNELSSIDSDKVEEIINKKMSEIQNIFNSIYNELMDACITNKLKTPSEGIKYGENENQSNLFRRQLFIEENSFNTANIEFVKIYSSLSKSDKAHNLLFNRKIVIFWHNNLNITIAEGQKSIIQSKQFLKSNNDYLKYIIALKSEEISVICLLYLIKKVISTLDSMYEDSNINQNPEEYILDYLNSAGTQELSDLFDINIPLSTASEELGSIFFEELRNTKIKDSLHSEQIKLFKSYLSNNTFSLEVSKKLKVKVGLYLIQIMIRSISFLADKYDKDSHKKVLSILQKNVHNYKVQNFLKFDSEFVSNYFYDIHKTFSSSIQMSKALPMIYAPMPWKKFNIGSYYLRNTTFSKVFSDNLEAIDMYSKADLSKVMNILDHQGSIPWRINNKILEVVEYIWAIGGDKGSIPKRFNERIVTKEMINKAASFKQRLDLLRESRNNREQHSLRSDFLIKLGIAKDFSKIKEFYFPHNIDYRGRTYPICPQFNHIGNDFSRGLLEYSEGKPLGVSGLKWLKIHLANCMGKDKIPFRERELYTEGIKEIIFKCANDPYNNLEWTESDDPWQTLATMLELNNAFKVILKYIYTIF